MADRFPIILNTNTNQLQELPSGDILDLTGSGIKSSGITTYTTSAQLNLGGGTNINTGTRGDILFYNSSGNIQKLSLGASGKVLKSNGTDLEYGDTGSIANVYYVSTSGTDASGFGSAVDRPFRSIKYACSNIGTPSSTAPAIIFVKAGTYEEAQLPIIVPAHTTIAGDSLRATIIKPASGLDSGGSIQNNRSIMFRMSNATVLQDLVMDGMGGYTPGSPAYKPENATIGGTYLALNAASPVTTKSPYIYNVTSFGNGATGAVLDGSVHASGNRSMLFHTYTAVHSDGLGILLKANANAEMISTFTYYCTVGFACIGGSKIRSLNSSNAYGEYAVYSAGFDTGETANQGTVKGTMLTYTNVLTQNFTPGEQITGGTSGATAYAVNVQAEPKRIYIVQKSGTFQANETVTGGSSGATATLAAASFETNQSGRILVTTFASSADAGDSLQFASTDGNAYQIQSVSSVTANSVAYHVLVFSTSRATPVPTNTTVNVRKEFSLIRLTGHDFLQVGTGGTDTTNWPNNPTQNPAQADQVITNETDPGRVYYTATDELGNFYVGDQFKVDQATGNVTLDASAFNLSGLESLRLGSVGGLIGAAVGEFSTDVTLSQNSDTKVSTQKAVKTYVDTLDGTTPVGGTFTVAGISTVTGTTQFTKQLNVSGVSTFHGNVNLLDGDRLRLGNSEDLQVYHDGNHSYIAENGSGDLKIQASAGSILLQRDNGHPMIQANVGGSCGLYHNNTLRLGTTSDGVAVTGNLSVSGVLTYEDVTNVDSVGIITARQGVRLGVDGTSSSNYISVGVGNDLKIWHQSSNNHSYISETGSGSLVVLADDFYVQDTSTNTMISAKEGAEVNLHFNGGTPKLSTTNTGVTVTGTATATTLSAGNIRITDDGASGPLASIMADDGNPWALQIGNSSYSTSLTTGHQFFVASGGNAFYEIRSSNSNYNDFILRVNNSGNSIKNCIKIAATAQTVELYAGGNKKLETTSTGVTVSGNLTATNLIGNGNNLTQIVTAGSTYNSNLDTANTVAGVYRLGTGISNGHSGMTNYGTLFHANNASDTGFQMYVNYNDGRAFLRGGNAATFNGSSGGGYANTTWAELAQSTRSFLPETDNNLDLGSLSKRWANVYVGDMNLSNKGKANDVDGTWGNYTLQEGEHDLFLINNRSGKRYKFNLTEIPYGVD